MIVPPSAVVGAAIDARARARDALAAIRADGWESSLLGIGTSEDKIASLRYNGFVNRLTDPVLEGMFMTEIYAFRGVTIYPHVAFSEGCEFKGLSDDDEAREYLNEQWRLPEISTEAAIWGRLYGGCATWIVTDRDLAELEEPLDPGEEILALRNVERPFVTPMMDPSTFDPAGNPTFFMLNPPQGQIHTTVHVSRLALWPGDLTPQRRRIQIGYWDFSVLQRPFDVLKRNGHVNQAAQQLLSEASLGILAIKDLWTSVSSGQQGQLLTRIRMFNQSRAQARAVIIDKDKEAFTRVNTTFAGVSDITDRMRQEVAAAFGIPVTRLMGEAPAGLNATGDADEKNFHKDIASYQRSHVEPRVHKLARALLDADQSPVASDGLTVKWPDLGAPSTAESATIYSTIAQADAALIDREVITPEQARSRFTPEGYSQDLDASPPEGEDGALADPLDLQGTSEGGNTPDGKSEPDQKLEPQSITALVDLISQAAKKTLPRDSVQEIIVMAFGVTPEQADKLLGSAGKDFEPPAPLPVLAPGAKAPPPKGPPGTPVLPPKVEKADHIEERAGKFVVTNEARTKDLGTYDTREEAEKRLGQIEAHKDAHDAIEHVDGFEESDHPRDEKGMFTAGEEKHIKLALYGARRALPSAGADYQAHITAHAKEFVSADLQHLIEMHDTAAEHARNMHIPNAKAGIEREKAKMAGDPLNRGGTVKSAEEFLASHEKSLAGNEKKARGYRKLLDKVQKHGIPARLLED